jgi:hypothetical protein
LTELLGICTRIWVFDPVPICCSVVVRVPLMKNTAVPNVEGGEPKFEPLTVTIELQPSPLLGTTSEMLGAATTVAVGVDVGPGVLVGTGVFVGVAVAPSGTKALKPDVMHGRRPSA